MDMPRKLLGRDWCKEREPVAEHNISLQAQTQTGRHTHRRRRESELALSAVNFRWIYKDSQWSPDFHGLWSPEFNELCHSSVRHVLCDWLHLTLCFYNSAHLSKLQHYGNHGGTGPSAYICLLEPRQQSGQCIYQARGLGLTSSSDRMGLSSPV